MYEIVLASFAAAMLFGGLPILAMIAGNLVHNHFERYSREVKR